MNKDSKSSESAKSDKIRLLLVDDQYLFLESLKLVIENITTDMDVVGIAINGEEAIKQAELLNPDIVLMDVRMPIMDGVTAAKTIHQKQGHILIIMLTTFEDDEYVTEAMKNGASGYLLKNLAPHMLVSAIRAVHDGSILMDPNIAGTLIQNLYSNKKVGEKITGERLPDWYYDLSSREKNIIKHMLLGKTNKEIASDVNIGEQTIRNYVSTIYAKLGTADRRETLAKIRTISPSYFS